MTIGYLSSGTLGFDTNTVITSKIARAAAAHHRQYKFVWRYVRRGPHHTYDIARDEIATIHAAGLGLGLVQHVADPGWYPSINLGTSYGSIAAAEASIAGYPPGCSLACDLEGVAHDASSKANWTAYNLNRDQYPAVRGPCMTQHVAFAADLIPGLDNSNMDIDILQADRLGGLPMFYLP
jgi:hypothetical protein